MTSPRAAFCLFCDDVRQEAGNKLSYMGVYNAEMHLAVPPDFSGQLVLPKLVVAFWLISDISDPPSRITLTVYGPPDRTEIFKHEATAAPVVQPPEDWAKKYLVSGQMPFLNLPVAGNGFFELAISTERESLVAGRLRVTIQSQPASYSGVGDVTAPTFSPPPSERSQPAVPASEHRRAPSRRRGPRIGRTLAPE
jgi:hypothetical protein